MTAVVSTVAQSNIDHHHHPNSSDSTASAAILPPSHPPAPISATIIPTSTTSPLSGAVPAQLPVRSYATATKTATPPTSAGASAPAQHAKPAVDSQMNGAMAQGGSQPASNPGNAANGIDHGRKPSVVINASGASGYTPNGGPVAQNGRPAISFGSMGSQGADSQSGAPFTAPNPSLGTPQRDARIITPTHSPSPIPQPMAASGGRPPSSLQNANNSLNFGSMGPDNDMMRGGPMPQGPASQIPMHERRTSSQSDMSNPNMPGMNRQGFVPPNAGRGRQSFPQQPFAGSPGPNFRPLANQGRGNMPSQFQPVPPGSPYARDRATPQQTPAQMAPMGGHPQMPYGAYQQHLGPHNQAQGMYGMPGYDPNSGYYPPYYYPPYGAQVPPQSPRPQYPSPFPGPPGAQMQPPFHPPGTPGMVRTPSQASERPPSSLGGPQTPMQHPPPPSQTPNSAQQASSSASSSFVRPKKSSAIKITDAQGNAINFAKPSPAPSTQAQSGNPVIVSTPNAPTPPPRVPSSQHNRTESKSTKSSEETKNAFAEQVKRQLEEDKRKQQEAASKTNPQPEESKAPAPAETQAVESNTVKEATAATEKAAAVAAADDSAKADADAAAKALQNDEDEKKRKEREEEERIEREIAEMEAAEREEEERERAFQEKRAKEKEASAAKEKEKAAKADEELKRQEREAEEREAARQQEKEGEKTEEPDDEAKALFASLKKPTLGPGAEASESGRETPVSETAGGDSSNEAASDAKAPQTRAAGSQKPKPAHLKLETSKPVERAEPTPGMQALKSARFLEIKEEMKYPDGFKSPNPALNQNTQRKGRAYDKDFLLQFQKIFKEKPSVDWDQKVKETLGPGDEPGSARPQSARTPSGQVSRSGSNRPGSGIQNFGGGPMGNFGGMPTSTLPAGTTSEQRFHASNMGGRPGSMGMPQMGRAPSNLGIGGSGVGMSRTNSLQMMRGMGGPNSPRQPSARGKGGSKRDDRTRSVRQEAEMSSKMPLTAHMEITPLERSTTGWKASSLGQAPGNAATAPDPSGNMAPDMVQRKVKAALNKMTPEKFDKISDQILEIAAQSKNESDGRTLRQVIQLTFEKACDEAHWAGMYAQFCHKMLTTMSPEIRDETIKDKNGNPVIGGNLFRKYLLNRCQEEFERGWQVNLPDKPEGESQEVTLLSDEYYVAAAAKRRGLGLIQFIGQLYKLRMLTLRIMHECVMRLLNFEGDPDEAAVENLTTLLKAVGPTMDEEEQGKQLLVTYFSRIEEVIMRNEKLPSRPKFMIMDLMDLKRAGWKGKDDSKGPKTIQQIHEEAEAAKAKEEAERQRTNQRGPAGGRMPQGRGDARNFSGGMPPPVDFARTNVNMDDLRKLQARGAQRQSGGGLGPGGSLGPSTLGARSGSRRGNLGPGSSGNTTRTNTPPVDSKKEEPTQQNAFSALAALDPSGEGTEDHDATSPPATQNSSKSPLAAAADDASSTA